jgi:NAD(P)-dependent dehydrogenase (short-subunit alcohol dehydrogenase family)
MNPDGKVAIITGSGGKGTGRAVARRFAQQGMAVVVSDTDDTGGDETVALIWAERGRAAFHPADVKNENEINGLIAFAESTFGGLGILVNNASKPDTMGLLTGWMDAMAVEILAPMRTTLAAIEAMRRRGGGPLRPTIQDWSDPDTRRFKWFA